MDEELLEEGVGADLEDLDDADNPLGLGNEDDDDDDEGLERDLD